MATKQGGITVGLNTPIQIGMAVLLAGFIWSASEFKSTCVVNFDTIKQQLNTIQSTQAKQETGIIGLTQRVDKLETAGSDLARKNAEDLMKLKEQLHEHTLTTGRTTVRSAP